MNHLFHFQFCFDNQEYNPCLYRLHNFLTARYKGVDVGEGCRLYTKG